jgi:hypothetical protein
MSDAPTAQHAPCMIRVVIRDEDARGSAPIHDKTGDHNEGYFREWITKTVWWALRNNKSVSMYPVN